jgi:hypothetical protein
MTLWKKSGIFLIATGIIHNAMGFAFGWPVLQTIAHAGFVNSIHDEMDRKAIFWFLFSGFMMMALGKFMQHYINQFDKPVPDFIGYYLLALTVIGCVMMPLSGFWIVLPQGVIIIFAHRKYRRQLSV